MAKMKPSETEFESAAASGRPSAAMVALFQQHETLDLTKAERLNLPQMVVIKEMPVGAVLVGEVFKVVESPAKQVSGFCLWLRIGAEERLMPVNGYIRKALAPECKKDDPAIEKKLKTYEGKKIAFKRLENKFNNQFSRDTFPFDVFILK